MSHFSRIKTSICTLSVLQKTLEDLGFEYFASQSSIAIKDSYGKFQYIDLLIKTGSKNLFGFVWDGNEYNLVVDLQFWDQSMSVDRFIDKITQQYALNSILKESTSQGFSKVKQEVMQDGAVKVVIQRWY